jgi:ankyrin repeat protein
MRAWQELLDAIDDGAVKRTKALLAQDPRQARATRRDGAPVLLLAVSSMMREPRIIEALLVAGADARAVFNGQPALHWAIDVNGPTGTGATPRRIFELLLAHGADLEARDARGWTALMKAVVSGTHDEARALLALGADESVRFAATALPCFVAGRTAADVARSA